MLETIKDRGILWATLLIFMIEAGVGFVVGLILLGLSWWAIKCGNVQRVFTQDVLDAYRYDISVVTIAGLIHLIVHHWLDWL